MASSVNIMLIGGPRDLMVVEADVPIVRVPVMRRLGMTTILSEGDLPTADALPFDMAEYRVRRLDEPQWHDHKEIQAVGDYIEPPLPCGHSRDHGPFSAHVDTRALFKAYSELPEYRNHMPVFCECGLMVAMRSTINLLEEHAGWQKWREERMKELGVLVDEMESIARYARSDNPDSAK